MHVSNILSFLNSSLISDHVSQQFVYHSVVSKAIVVVTPHFSVFPWASQSQIRFVSSLRNRQGEDDPDNASLKGLCVFRNDKVQHAV